MKICLIGNGLTNLILAKILLKKKFKVDLYFKKRKNNSLIRTIGISSQNLKFLRQNIYNVNKIGWPINKIKIYNEKNKKKEILNFNSKKYPRFYIVKNIKIYNIINKNLKLEKNFLQKKINNNSFYTSIINNKNYDLIINSESQNEISSNFFFNKVNKKYNSSAYTTIIKHKKLKNNIAKQIFTNLGPIAFLPLSNKETSIVFSIYKNKNSFNLDQIKELIKKYNINYKIYSFYNLEKFNLNFSTLKKYYFKNILSFGENLHTVHPLAGQGFNMILRDIKILSKIIDEKMELGLPIDESVLREFQNETKHFNFIFASGIDFIHEFFKFDNKIKNNYSKIIFKILDNNKKFNKYTSMFADKGLNIYY